MTRPHRRSSSPSEGPATRSPSADGASGPPSTRRRGRFWPLTLLLPRTFQARLTMGFVGVVALTLILVSAFVIKSLDDYFSTQEVVDLGVRADTVRAWVVA